MSNKLLSLGIAIGILIPNVVLSEVAICQRNSSTACEIEDNNSVKTKSLTIANIFMRSRGL